MSDKKLTQAQINDIRRQQHERDVMDALEWFKDEADELKTPPDPMKRRQPKVTRHMSREQRRVSTQSLNPITAIYGKESMWNETPVIDPEKTTLTREVGPGDVYNDRNYRTGKSSRTANGAGNKTAYRGRRAYGGGNNRKSFEELLKEYE